MILTFNEEMRGLRISLPLSSHFGLTEEKKEKDLFFFFFFFFLGFGV